MCNALQEPKASKSALKENDLYGRVSADNLFGPSVAVKLVSQFVRFGLFNLYTSLYKHLT